MWNNELGRPIQRGVGPRAAPQNQQWGQLAQALAGAQGQSMAAPAASPVTAQMQPGGGMTIGHAPMPQPAPMAWNPGQQMGRPMEGGQPNALADALQRRFGARPTRGRSPYMP